MTAINKIANEVLNPTAIKNKGTTYWYIKKVVGNKSAQYTRAKTYYKNRFGFWSWIATIYKNGVTKRTMFALSATRVKAEARANRLL